MPRYPKPRHPKSASDRATVKARQLQQYLHRPGFIPASTHPFVKQIVLNQPKQRFSIKRFLARGPSLVAAGLKASLGAILICTQIIVSPVVWLLNHLQL